MPLKVECALSPYRIRIFYQWQQIAAVERGGQRILVLSGGQERGHDVDVGSFYVDGLALFKTFRPAHEKWTTDAAFINIGFFAPQPCAMASL